MKEIKEVSSSKKTYTIKNLKKGTYYRYNIKAYKVLSNGEKRIISVSQTAYVVTTGGKYGNPTKVTYNKKSLTLKKGKSLTLKPKIKYQKKEKRYVAKFRYESSKTSIVSVSKKGKLKAKKKGTAYIYIYAQNGYSKKLKVTVK